MLGANVSGIRLWRMCNLDEDSHSSASTRQLLWRTLTVKPLRVYARACPFSMMRSVR
jgi:hypothetical protein